MPAHLTERTKRIWKLHMDGKRNEEIEVILGAPRSVVACAVRRGRDAGVLPKPKLRGSVDKRAQTMIRRGSIGHIIDSLSEEQGAWLVDSARKFECETLAEFILEVVRDAHAEELEGQDDGNDT